MAIDNFNFTSGAGNVVTPTLYWAGNGATFGGSGTWDASTSSTWSTSSTTVIPAKWDTTKLGSFGGPTAGTVSVVGTVNAAQGLSFTTNGYQVNPGAGGKIVLTGANAAANTINTDPELPPPSILFSTAPQA